MVGGNHVAVVVGSCSTGQRLVPAFSWAERITQQHVVQSVICDIGPNCNNGKQTYNDCYRYQFQLETVNHLNHCREAVSWVF